MCVPMLDMASLVIAFHAASHSPRPHLRHGTNAHRQVPHQLLLFLTSVMRLVVLLKSTHEPADGVFDEDPSAIVARVAPLVGRIRHTTLHPVPF